MNKITLKKPIIRNSRVTAVYEVEGEWREAFNRAESFYYEYTLDGKGVDLSGVPDGVLMIPLLGNILPFAWLYDAVVAAPETDSAFLRCISNVREGYRKMYPELEFKGTLSVEKEIPAKNVDEEGGSAVFFSGGADSWYSLVSHLSEKPLMVTVYGADIPLTDAVGIENAGKLARETAGRLGLSLLEIRTNMRGFLVYKPLIDMVAPTGDAWWHGFQHGLGINSLAAPIAYLKGLDKVYMAGSHASTDKDFVRVTCASDASIDNHVRYAGARVIHDGYEKTRMDKVRYLAQHSKETGGATLRVCWEKRGGGNCCLCEKCTRTILELYACGADPKSFGFPQAGIMALRAALYRNRLQSHDKSIVIDYIDAQNALKETMKTDRRLWPLGRFLKEDYSRDLVK